MIFFKVEKAVLVIGFMCCSFCVEFACSHCVSVGSLRVLQLLLHSPNTCRFYIGDTKLPVGVNTSVNP